MNNQSHNAQEHYKKTQIMTASPAQLLVMLYDAAVVAMDTAILELEKKSLRYDIVSNNLIKAQEIIGELLATLDFDKSPEIARNLESLYHYFIRRLMEGNIKKEIFIIEEVRNGMNTLKEAWDTASQKVQKDQGKEEQTPPLTPSAQSPYAKPKDSKPQGSGSKGGGLNIKG